MHSFSPKTSREEDWRIILKWILEESGVSVLSGFRCLYKFLCRALLNTLKEPLGSVKGWEFFDQVGYFQFVHKESAVWS
jgi:hypothetical protein